MIFQLVLLSALTGLACCTGDSEEDCPDPATTLCLAVYQPVCGIKGNDLKTFGNSCNLSVACRDGWKYWNDGDCTEALKKYNCCTGPRVTKPCPAGTPRCSFEEKLVCGRRDNEYRTFINSCLLWTHCEEGFRFFKDGACTDSCCSSDC